MSLNLSEICLAAARKVFGARVDVERIAKGYIESAISRVGINYQVDIEKVPESDLREMAECAGWFVSDKNIHITPSEPNIGAVRDRIAEHVHTQFPRLAMYSVIR